MKIIKYLMRMVVLLICVSIVSFIMASVSPVDPLQTNVGQAALGSMSREQIEKLEEYWGVHTPPVKRYLSWAAGLLRGDMGISLLYRRPVSNVLAEKLSNSLFMLCSAWVISGIFGFLLGVMAGVNRGKLIDKLVTAYSITISAAPAFWLAMVLLMIFSVWLKLLPIGLSVPIGVESAQVTIGERVMHAILPALTLSITGISNIALHTREKMIEVMESDYVLFAKARGESKREIIRRHGLRNVIIPAITLQFASISEIIGGSVLAEQVFSYPGLGQAAVTAGLGGDIPLLLGITMLTAVLVFTGNMIADLLYGAADPRIRRGNAYEK